MNRRIPPKLVLFGITIIMILFLWGCSSGPKQESPEQFKMRIENGGLTSFEIEHGIGPVKESIKLGPIDNTVADKGSSIFLAKCNSCHLLDDKKTGPPLRDVAKRRSPEYILNQIMNPEQMGKYHPDGKKLVAQYMVYMTIQGVTMDDARAVLEFLRRASDQPSGTPIATTGQ